MQTTQSVFMIRPSGFAANQETLLSNFFQKITQKNENHMAEALVAFNGYVAALQQAGVDVRVIDEISGQETPDALFPNNWIALLGDGSLFTFPMEALNRRRERRQDIIAQLANDFVIERRIDLSTHELAGRFLEGTGSLILDHQHKLAYCCLSSRSSPEVGHEFECHSGYKIVWFDAVDRNNQPIYHTNVMMSVGAQFAIICLESLCNEAQKSALIATLERSGKTLIDVSFAQMEAFACNVLELRAEDGSPVYAMSTRAWASFTLQQQGLISGYARLALGPIDIIEDLGGGGARCMLAEIFLQKKLAVG
ncbi:amidinotransferase [Serratia proteamaculans]|uniref:Amidinotransferase n=1 Tax=Serratia proteamaculans TaxID=28151 RepID=A0A7U0N9W2_SERPR|nr:arginine deiminase-related protein [Serratia proteamaculans]MBO1505167.1 amidinotransferase [Serratia proteamaculans]MDW5512889.1 arginine deiminase-related protein [Serratia proteamaculans]QQX55215.1 amidinotransferase [Serratia proteamaculans]